MDEGYDRRNETTKYRGARCVSVVVWYRAIVIRSALSEIVTNRLNERAVVTFPVTF